MTWEWLFTVAGVCWAAGGFMRILDWLERI